ncbi:response regulator [Mucilaginibacter sp. 21P]|uniref:response regulator n=1 Tax=Mucilaginibacter sp. 21P TaxID=2778902 RepID=UPI001C55E497|nr:response regulator [Mucilaginibacter sp. 21P]QXV63795.1 response regulator [Mucilaginibacter sp. 21P]
MEKPLIMICEDDEEILQIYEVILMDHDYHVITESNSLLLFELLKKTIPDLLILNLRMPYLSGDRIAYLLTSHDKYASIPILMISADIRVQEVVKDLQLKDYLLKPFDIDVLVQTVNRFFPK